MTLQLEDRNWYIVYSKPRQEKYAQFHLQQKGLEVFFPQLLLPQWRQKTSRVVPLFPSYLFVRIRYSDESQYVCWSPGVKRFVSFDGVPAPVDDGIVAYLMQQGTPGGFIMAQTDLKVGQRVEVISGPFGGLDGIIQDPPDAKQRVKVLLTMLNRQVRVQLPAQFVKSSWVLAPRADSNSCKIESDL